MRKYLALVFVLLLALACKGPQTPSDYEVFSSREQLCIMVGYKNMIDFSAGELQYSWNHDKLIYRVGVGTVAEEASTGTFVETVQQYFIVKFTQALGDEQSKVRGKLVLCSPAIASGIRTYDLKDARVIKREDGKVWIWDTSLHLGIVIPSGE